MSEITLDTKTLIKGFGGRAMLWRKLRDAGVEISPRTIDNWADRGCMPLKRFAALADIAKKEGRTLKLDDFLTKATK